MAGTRGYASRIHVVRHDPDDLRELDDLGTFEGVALMLNYRAVEAELLIAISPLKLEDDLRDNGSAGIRIAIDKERRAFVVGVPRDVLHLKADPVRMLVAVGSALSFNDDVPGEGAVTLR